MQEFKAARLSVSKVSEKEWDFIVNELIEGYEDDAGLPAATKGVEDAMEDAGLPNGVTIMESKEIPESDMPTTDTVLAEETTATSSRPASIGGSRPGSRAGPVKKSTSRPGSRAGSLAPPRTASRGRSRTPGARAGSAQPMGTVAEEMDVIGE